MAVIVTCKDPAALLREIKAAIVEKRVTTWDCDKDGDFSHTPDQWKHKAWLRPAIQEGALVFGIIPTRQAPISNLIYGVYHGRFIEMLLVHFDKSFTSAASSALPLSVDVVAPTG